MLFSEPKIPQSGDGTALLRPWRVISVLFSEPKIPQLPHPDDQRKRGGRFQCSSASRKFLNAARPSRSAGAADFSALQRAENSSMRISANVSNSVCDFSALQRAENSSIGAVEIEKPALLHFSALQRAENSSIETQYGLCKPRSGISVLFSEPKIPQCPVDDRRCRSRIPFQCSSASRKFLNGTAGWTPSSIPPISVLFSEPKIPQSSISAPVDGWCANFSALQRAENSSMRAERIANAPTPDDFSALQRAENSSMARAR